MSMIEKNGLMRYVDKDGNQSLLYPITKAELVDGAVQTVNGIAPDDNGNVEVAIPSPVVSFNDLEDKPFGTEMGEILPETTVAVDPDMGGAMLPDVLDVVAGSTYTVNYNGAEYVCTAQSFSPAEDVTTVVLGNLGAMTGGEDTGEPFVMLCLDASAAAEMGAGAQIAPLDGTETITLSISGEVIKQLDSKYLEPFNVVDEDEVELLPETTITDFQAYGTYYACQLESSIPLVEGRTYIIMWDGVRYEFVCSIIKYGGVMDAPGLGNYDSVDPFQIVTVSLDDTTSVTAICTNQFDGTPHTVSITKAKYYDCELKPECLPEHVHDEYVTETELTAKGYVTNESLNSKGYLTSVPSKYVTETELTAKNYAPKSNPVFAGSISLGRKTDSTVGYGSVAEGSNTTASGNYSHAEGGSTTASGYSSHAEGGSTTASGHYSHAEGFVTTASGYSSHAEGSNITASGDSSHAEGSNTTASGNYSHAEGRSTIAAGNDQHVQGTYNIEDADGKYAHIVGNGNTENARSNAHTLDWDGNAWFEGDVYVGGTGQDDAAAVKLVREDELASKGYLTSFTETDPTVPAWAKAATKPAYTAKEVGAAETDHTHDDYFPVSGGTINGDTNVVGVLRSNGQQAFYYATATKSQTIGTGNATGGTIIACGAEANTTINGANVKMKNALPQASNTHTLGTTSARWKEIYSNSAVNVASDRRLKRDINYVGDAKVFLDFINSLKVATYNYNDDETNAQARIGLIAQDVQEADADLSKFFVTEGEDSMLGMTPANLVFALIAAVQKLSAEVEELKSAK